jgi:hypothetical protein
MLIDGLEILVQRQRVVKARRERRIAAAPAPAAGGRAEIGAQPLEQLVR